MRRGAGGRPPKFDEPRRPVTVTLPERTLETLSRVDEDLARSIVKVTDAFTARGGHPALDVVEVAKGSALIVVGAIRALRQIPWLRLAEVSPGRYLLTVASGTPVESLEVALLDLLEDLPRDDPERSLLEELRRLVTGRRRGAAISKSEILFVSPGARSR